MSVPQSESTAYQTLRTELDAKTTALLEQCHVFYAFNKQQFDEGAAKHPIPDGEKYSRLPGGGFCPSKHASALIEGLDANSTWIVQQVEAQGLQKAEVLYHLGNHECFYTGDISDALEATDNRYSTEFVWSVYRDNYPEDS